MRKCRFDSKWSVTQRTHKGSDGTVVEADASSEGEARLSHEKVEIDSSTLGPTQFSLSSHKPQIELQILVGKWEMS